MPRLVDFSAITLGQGGRHSGVTIGCNTPFSSPPLSVCFQGLRAPSRTHPVKHSLWGGRDAKALCRLMLR